MLLSGHAHTVAPGEGCAVNLGVIQMRVLAAGEATTNGAFTLAEFTGGQGPWTVPHIHREMEESFYVLDGESPSPSASRRFRQTQGHTSWSRAEPGTGSPQVPKAAGSSPSWCPAA